MWISNAHNLHCFVALLLGAAYSVPIHLQYGRKVVLLWSLFFSTVLFVGANVSLVYR